MHLAWSVAEGRLVDGPPVAPVPESRVAPVADAATGPH